MTTGWDDSNYGPEETTSTTKDAIILGADLDEFPVGWKWRGIFLRTKQPVRGPDGKAVGKMKTALHELRGADGEIYGLWSCAALDKGLATAVPGDLVTVIYGGTKAIPGQASPMHLWETRIARPKPGTEAAAANGGKGKVDDISF